MSWFRRHQTQPLRYYLYISDVKLDMLFEQIQQSVLKRISAEVKVDLKVASLRLSGTEDPGLTRAAKLRVVERFIDQHHHVGTIRAPGQEYFRGQLPMQWGWSPTGSEYASLPVVFFQGEDGEQAVFLAGSRCHVLGKPAPSRSADMESQLPSVVAAIGEYISEEPKIGEWIRAVRASAQLNLNPYKQGDEDHSPAWLDVSMRHMFVSDAFEPRAPEEILRSAMTIRFNSPAQRLEFLAVPLIEGQVRRPIRKKGQEDHHCILGTPLYVAIAPRFIRPQAP